MIYGYAQLSTDGQSVDSQIEQLRAAGAEQVYREKRASGARADRVQLRRVLAQLGKGDVLTVTRLDHLARSTRDLLNTLAAITDKGAGFRSLGDTWIDTTTAHAPLMFAVLGGLAEFDRALIRAPMSEGCKRQGAEPEARTQAEADGASAPRGDQAAGRGRGNACGDWAQL